MKLALSFFALLGAVAEAHAPTVSSAAPIPYASTAPAAQASLGQTVPQVVISGWRLACDPHHTEVACQVINQVTVRSSNSIITAVSVRLPAKAKAPVMIVQAPLGVAINGSVRVGFTNGVQQIMPFLTCNKNGCFARAQISDPLLNSIHSAKQQLHIAYDILDANEGKQTITIALGLTVSPRPTNGFTKQILSRKNKP